MSYESEINSGITNIKIVTTSSGFCSYIVGFSVPWYKVHKTHGATRTNRTVVNSITPYISNFRYVDYVLVMAYDYTATTSNVTGLLAPLPSIVSKNLLQKA